MVLKSDGTVLVVRKWFMMFVMVGKRRSRFSHRSVVGIGSSSLFFSSDFWITSRINYSVTGLKFSKGVPEKKEVFTSVDRIVQGKQFLVLRILSVKNSLKNVWKSNRVKARWKRWTFDLPMNTFEVVKQFFRWLASLDRGRVEGYFGVVNKFGNFAFCIFIYFFVNGKLEHVPVPLSSTTFLFQCSQLISNSVVLGGWFPVLELSLADRSMLVQDDMRCPAGVWSSLICPTWQWLSWRHPAREWSSRHRARAWLSYCPGDAWQGCGHCQEALQECKQGLSNFLLFITLLWVYQLLPSMMTLTLFQDYRVVRHINCKIVYFKFLSIVV